MTALVPLLLLACPIGEPFPREEWPSVAAQVAAQKAEAIKGLEDYAFTLDGADKDRKGIRTDGVVVIQNGQIIYEKYGRGFTRTHRHLAWSVTKTIINALTGIAVQRGWLKLDDPICDHLVLKSKEACDKLHVRHLLEFSSGLDWKEVYENQSNQASSVLAMLYGQGQQDMANFIASHPFRDPPGESYEYSSGDSTLLAAVLDGAVRPQIGADWPWQTLFNPLGMFTAVLERDGKGAFVGSSYFYATPRDMARFGYLFLKDGCWNGNRVLPEGWVHDSLQPSAGFLKKRVDRDPDEMYGWQWTMNLTVPGIQDTLPLPDAPPDTFAARGHWGQSITVIPSRNLVVVRVADDRDKTFSLSTFLKHVLEVAQ